MEKLRSPQAEVERRAAAYEVVDTFTVRGIPAEARCLDLWSPVIPDTPYQRVLDVAVDAPFPFTLGHDADQGNLILHGRIHQPVPGQVECRIRYRVERTPLPGDQGRAWAGGSPWTGGPPALLARFLRPEQHVEVSQRTRELAREIVGPESDPLEQARRIYDHVTGYMSYDAQQQSWKGSTEHALTCTVGNCNDIHALFISLCRSIGIPSRLVMGQALEAPAPGQEDCEICGYHCWAEFFAPGLGWVPADASCACKYWKGHLFGELELNHVAWSIGRDILLEPAQRGNRLLFFASPYAEVDGVPHAEIARGITFTQR